MFYLQIFLTSFLVTLIITPFVIRHFVSAGIVDRPNKRKVHESIIPRMGGTIVFLVAILIFLIFFKQIESYRVFLVSSIIIALIGNLDDVFTLRWIHKLIAQLTVSSFITFDIYSRINSVQILGYVLPDFVAIILIILLIVGLLNAINFMDGLDGLVSGYSIVSLTVILFLGYALGNQFVIIMAIGLLGSLLGFMKYNTFPAKIFLGDTGSLSLAFFLTYLVLTLGFLLPGKHLNLDLSFVLIFFALPITDTLKVIVKRLYNRQSPFQPDKTHLHHKILGLEIRQKITTFIIHLFSILFVGIALFYFRESNNYLVFLAFILVLVVLFIPNIVGYFRNLFFNKLYENLRYIPKIAVRGFYYIFPIFTVIAIILFLTPIIRSQIIFNTLEIISILVLYLILFAISFGKKRSVETLNHLYVFFNFIIFLAIFKFPDNNLNFDFLNFSFSYLWLLYSGLILTFLIVIYFVYIREKMLNHKISLYYGQDLLLIVIMLLVFAISNFVQNEFLQKLNILFLASFSLYSLHLIAVRVYNKYSEVFFYFSYIIPVISIVVLLIINL